MGPKWYWITVVVCITIYHNDIHLSTIYISGGSDQLWTWKNGAVTIYNGAKCLDVVGGDESNGAGLQIYDCAEGSPNQQFQYTPWGENQSVSEFLIFTYFLAYAHVPSRIVSSGQRLTSVLISYVATIPPVTAFICGTVVGPIPIKTGTPATCSLLLLYSLFNRNYL